jgi:mRNA interferase YafQ
MRAIERTTQFKRDFKREMKGRRRTTLEVALTDLLRALVSDAPLAEKYRDHALSGEWSGFRDCHVKPDLVLIYEKPDADTLRLVRLGSHSELGW